MIQNRPFSSFFFFFFLYSLTRFITSCSSLNPNFEACKPATCGNQNISYPFYIEGRQGSLCGFPGFGLSCSGNGLPILNFSNYLYVIHEISYETQSVRVSEVANSSSNDNSCTIPLTHNITLDGTRFSFAPNQTDLFLLFGCKNYGDLLKYKVGCSLEGNETVPVLGMTEKNRDLSSAWEKCHAGMVVVKTKVGNETKDGEINGDVLRRGFILKWTVSSCSLCERTGGKCGFVSNPSVYSFKCYCPDGDHALKCDPEDQNKTLGWKLGLIIAQCSSPRLPWALPNMPIAKAISGLVHSCSYCKLPIAEAYGSFFILFLSSSIVGYCLRLN